jgi:hypothetical protein
LEIRNLEKSKFGKISNLEFLILKFKNLKNLEKYDKN